jgi:hypothetical protein
MFIRRITVMAAAASTVLLGTAGAASASPAYTSYRLSAYTSGMCLSPLPGPLTPGTHVTQNFCNDAGSQQWIIADVTADGSPIRNLAAGMCLDIDGHSHAAQAAVALQPCSSRPTQRWNVYNLTVSQTDRPTRVGMIALNKASGLCLDILGHPNSPDGTAVQDNCSWDYEDQFWRAEPTHHAAKPGDQIVCRVVCSQP